jgi:hypothetical protein
VKRSYPVGNRPYLPQVRSPLFPQVTIALIFPQVRSPVLSDLVKLLDYLPDSADLGEYQASAPFRFSIPQY